MTLNGLIAFTSYIVHIYYRWTRVTFRRYGLRGVLDASYRPRRAGVGVGSRRNPYGRAHSHLKGIPAALLIAQHRASLAGVGRHRVV